MALTPRTAQVCGRTILKLSDAIDQLDGVILIPPSEAQMLDAAKAVLDRAFDEVMVMFSHLNNSVVNERQARHQLEIDTLVQAAKKGSST